MFFEDTPNITITTGDYSPGSIGGNATVNIGDAVLQERVKALENLVAEKDERIREKDERIRDLKDVIDTIKSK